MKIERYFTRPESSGYDVYKEFFWKKADVKIEDFQTGEIIFEGHDLDFPAHYSQQACDIIASKYFFRNIDGNGTSETSLRQVIHRMVKFWVDALIEEGVIDGRWLIPDYYNFNQSIEENCYNYFTGSAEVLYDELVFTLLNQMWAPNSPQWFNTGIKYYGIHGESDDMYYYDESGIHKSPDRYTRSQTSACFIIPVTDNILGKNSITDHFVTESKLFKGGSGVGTNFSPIRAEGERLSSGGVSSGVMSFLLGLDRNAGAIKSGGTTRRAAKMVILDVNHPDIEEFINWKVHEEKKAQDLISLGYSGGMTGEAYQTVSGQNSNNSVRVTKTFMDKVLGKVEDTKYWLKGRKDKTKDKLVNAKDLFHKIAEAAWYCADPGIQFDDRYNEWHTAPNAGWINATNPCSEFAFIDNSACNLASINLLQCDYFSFDNDETLRRLVHLCQLVLEASIYWGQFPTEEVAKNSYLYRPTGLGYTNLGAFLLNRGIAYDSDEGRNLAAHITGIMTAQSYLTSTLLAEEIGYCEGYRENFDDMITVLEKHDEKAEENGDTEVCNIFTEVIDNVFRSGIRNMQTTVLAPTGTISFAMDCYSTGIEPFFSHKMYKKCSDGSMMEIINPLAQVYVEKTATCEEEKEIINDYFDDYGTYQGCSNLTPEDEKILQTANEIDPMGHVKMMAAVQPFISGSISKTVNLPNSATVEDIENIYIEAYKLGLKSISIYRDGSKGTQPLNVKKEDDFDVTVEEVSKVQELPYLSVLEKEEFEPKTINLTVSDNQNYLIRASQEFIDIESNKTVEAYENLPTQFERKKPEGIRKGSTHTAKVGNVELYITVGYYPSGELCEIFVSSDKEGTEIKGLLSSLSKSISHMLQYGIEPLKIAEMLRNQRYEPQGVVTRHPYIKMCTSISDLISRVIELECGDYSRCQVKPENYYKMKQAEKELGELLEEINTEYTLGNPKKHYQFKDDEKAEELAQEERELLKQLEEVTEPKSENIPDPDMDIADLWNESEYTGNECPNCHSTRMVPNGTCEICLDCFSTSSCG